MVKDLGNQNFNDLLKAIEKSVNEKKYSWRELERQVSSYNLIHPYTSIAAANIPDLLVFEPKFLLDPVS
jgi:hypothetical protein